MVYERHRHRYEVNPRYRRRLEEAGLICSGTSPDAASDLRPRRLPDGIEIAAARQRGNIQLQFAGRAPVELFNIELRAGETRYAVASTAMGEVRASRVVEAHSASR